ncbi:MAG: patatin-like phospholipase family protein [Parvularculaceae bacterium]
MASGGGSRAAVFAAAGLEALAEAGVLHRATHISSVSGGGFAASYFALHRPASREEFAEFRKTMRRNYLNATVLRQFLKPNRLSSPTRRLSSLQDALDKAFLDGARFGDLDAGPTLLVNAARYDDGRRFVFSNLGIPEEAPVFEPYSDDTLRAASFSLPGCARAAPASFSLSLAIAISAAFPPILGPAALELPGACEGGARYSHLGDGGIIDNTGVETLAEIAVRDVKSGKPLKRVLIISFNAGRRASSEVMMQERNLKLWTTDPGRVVDMPAMQAEGWRDLVMPRVIKDLNVPFEIVSLRYTDARLDAWPVSCGKKDGGAEAIAAHLAEIPTNLKITACDADLVEAAARDVVKRTFPEDRFKSP